jgi:hypothetical protein
MLGTGICMGGDLPWTGICHERFAGKYFRGSCCDLFLGRSTAELLQLQN